MAYIIAFVGVKPARLEDAARIAVVHVRSWQAAYKGLLPQEYPDGLDPVRRADGWKRNLNQPASSRDATLVIDSGEVLPGSANAGPTRDEDENSERAGEVRAIYLLPEAWGKGLGRQLMSAALKHLADVGFQQASLWVLDSDIRARRFYEAGG